MGLDHGENEDSARGRRGRPPVAGLAERRHAELTRVAFAVFTEDGYEQASVSEIARRAGMGQGTLYRYVNGKRELLDMVFDHCVEQLMASIGPEHLMETVEAPSWDSARVVVEDLGDRLYRLVDANPGLLKMVTVQGGAVDRELKYRVGGLYRSVNGMILQMLERAHERGWAQVDDHEQLTVLSRTLPALILPGLALLLEHQDSEDKRERFVHSASIMAQHGILGSVRS